MNATFLCARAHNTRAHNTRAHNARACHRVWRRIANMNSLMELLRGVVPANTSTHTLALTLAATSAALLLTAGAAAAGRFWNRRLRTTDLNGGQLVAEVLKAHGA